MRDETGHLKLEPKMALIYKLKILCLTYKWFINRGFGRELQQNESFF